ncbi:zinc finger protein 704 [Discoglossus pictus]
MQGGLFTLGSQGVSVRYGLASARDHHVNLRHQSSQILSHHQITVQDMETKEIIFMDRSDCEHEEEMEQECPRSICLLEQKRKVVSSNIDVPQPRKYEEADMDKVTAAMVLTSLSTSPLVHSPPFQLTDQDGPWKEVGFVPSSIGSSDYCSWSTVSDYSNPSTPSPPLSVDGFRHFRKLGHPDDTTEDTESSSLMFEAPAPRKRKNSMRVMFRCLWKNCGKVLSTVAGIKKHIRTIHLGHIWESDDNEGEEDFYYTEIRLNTDSVTEGRSSLSPIFPSIASSPSRESGSSEVICTKTDTKLSSPLSRSAPSTLYFVRSDHAYQATSPVTIPGSKMVNRHGNNCSGSWQSSPVTFTGNSVSMPCYTDSQEHRQPLQTSLSSPPRGGLGVRKPRGDGKKCRKIYGIENRDKWCTACRWKKACQRFPD